MTSNFPIEFHTPHLEHMQHMVSLQNHGSDLRPQTHESLLHPTLAASNSPNGLPQLLSKLRKQGKSLNALTVIIGSSWDCGACDVWVCMHSKKWFTTSKQECSVCINWLTPQAITKHSPVRALGKGKIYLRGALDTPELVYPQGNRSTFWAQILGVPTSNQIF